MDCDRGDDLTTDEITLLVAHFVDHHVQKKVRLTGGDPAARPDLVQIIKPIAGTGAIDDLAMTTNGLSLASRAQEYAEPPRPALHARRSNRPSSRA